MLKIIEYSFEVYAVLKLMLTSFIVRWSIFMVWFSKGWENKLKLIINQQDSRNVQ